MDQAKGILAYIQVKHPDKNYDVDGAMNELVVYEQRPGVSGKTIRTLFNGLSLLKLPPEIQAAIRAGTLPVSQGYFFAANLDCPDLRNSL
jgi:hypothetical protein